MDCQSIQSQRGVTSCSRTREPSKTGNSPEGVLLQLSPINIAFYADFKMVPGGESNRGDNIKNGGASQDLLARVCGEAIPII